MNFRQAGIFLILTLGGLFLLPGVSNTQEGEAPATGDISGSTAGATGNEGETEGEPSVPPQGEPSSPLQVAQADVPVGVEDRLISLDFRQAQIQTVLEALARKAGINIVTTAQVTGEVTIHLEDVRWERALDTIISTSGLAYEKQENVILVATLEQLKTRREAMQALTQIEPVIT